MAENINLHDVYDKNINFLIGSGASYGLFPTLALNIKGDSGEAQTIETLATHFEQSGNKTNSAYLFMYYFKNCIKPVLDFDLSAPSNLADPSKKQVIDNYKTFINTLLTILQRRKNYEKKCNVFTTNYDGCFVGVADEILKSSAMDFIVNDGTRGFSRRYLQARNFNSVVSQTGIFDRHRIDTPQINLIHLHGSVYWKNDNDNILVDYQNTHNSDLVEKGQEQALTVFSGFLNNPNATVGNIPKVALVSKAMNKFWEGYQKLPIVNPTKWKFHETVFEEHYYQMLRLLSYELEKPNSVFITFGFSFADEHILNLVKRSLSNPSLQVFVCCFNQAELEKMQSYFKPYNNVEYVSIAGNLDFTAFNKDVFNYSSATELPSVTDANTQSDDAA